MSPEKEQLEKQIADIEARMGREWRLYQRYSECLVKLRLRLQIRLNAGAALARKAAAAKSKQLFGYIQQKAERLRQANPIAFLRLYMPRSYDWDIREADPQVIED